MTVQGGRWKLLLLNQQQSLFFLYSSDCYSLSVLKRTSHSSMDSVKHYRISCLQNSQVYISPGNTFPSLHHLVEHYSGLCAVKALDWTTCLSEALLIKKINKNETTLTWTMGALFQALQTDCVVLLRSLASSRASMKAENPGLCQQPGGGRPSTGRTLAGVADSAGYFSSAIMFYQKGQS